MSLAWPWWLLALPLPWLARRLLSPATGVALRVPCLPARAEAAESGRARVALWIAALAWLLLLLAAARPQAPADAGNELARGRDLMLAFDLSASMGHVDLLLDGQALERLGAARKLADAFLQKRNGDRVGLIVFGSQAYLHTPLTGDLQAVREALASTEVGLAGPETALGDAIALAVKHMQGLPDQDRVLLVLTDGASNAGTLALPRAAWLAQRAGVRIHLIGVGVAASGNSLDESTLRNIAAQTGGTYARATDGPSLRAFLQSIDTLESSGLAVPAPRPPRELYAWPLGLALLLAGATALYATMAGRT
jgi:Ca-activated chloride channel family protein